MNTIQHLLSLALWLAGIGHFCVLAASFQVPRQLGWAEDLPKVRPFNRKLMWVYGGFTVLTIAAFAAFALTIRRLRHIFSLILINGKPRSPDYY